VPGTIRPNGLAYGRGGSDPIPARYRTAASGTIRPAESTGQPGEERSDVGSDAYTPRPDRSAVPYHRCSLTPTCRHMSSTGQVEHLGSRPVQMCFPNGTSSALISTQ
jgi:hypothetical protein